MSLSFDLMRVKRHNWPLQFRGKDQLPTSVIPLDFECAIGRECRHDHARRSVPLGIYRALDLLQGPLLSVGRGLRTCRYPSQVQLGVKRMSSSASSCGV